MQVTETRQEQDDEETISELMITNFTRADFGTYCCVARNELDRSGFVFSLTRIFPLLTFINYLLESGISKIGISR